MVSVCFYFQVHQPFRLKKHSIFDIGKNQDFFDTDDPKLSNEQILKKVARKCYLPANRVLLNIIRANPDFKISFSFSGVFLEQCEKYAPEVIDSFKELVNTGNVEILSETYYHSLAFLYSKEEFREQVKLHKNMIKRIFNYNPKIFRNTELIYSDDLAREIESFGFEGIITEGADHILHWRSPNFVYTPKNTAMKLLLKNYKLSDDIAFRFSQKSWNEWPLTAEKYSQWVNSINGDGQILNLFMDYETFGEHQWEDTGIFDFLYALPIEINKHPDNNFKTPSEVISEYSSVSELSIPNFISWADVERDLSAWLSNSMQHSAINSIYELREKLLKLDNPELLDRWRKMQTSDHFYYMCTKWFNDGDVHKYFNPYESPYDAFITYMNALKDLSLMIDKEIEKNNLKKVGLIN